MSGVHFGHEHPHTSELRAAPRPEGLLHRVPTGRKLACALTIIAVTALTPVTWWWWHATVAALLVAAIMVGRIPFLPLLKRLMWFAPFVAGAALAATWHGPTGPGWRAVALRGGLSLLTMLVLAATTPFNAQIGVLRRLRVPGLLVTTLALMHRYLFVLGDEAGRMRRARASRTLVRSRRLDWALSANVVGRLFVRASERAERIYLAMCARGWR